MTRRDWNKKHAYGPRVGTGNSSPAGLISKLRQEQRIKTCVKSLFVQILRSVFSLCS